MESYYTLSCQMKDLSRGEIILKNKQLELRYSEAEKQIRMKLTVLFSGKVI